MKLHIGCGKRHIPGFVHIDQIAFPHVDYVQDVRDLKNFDDGSADLVYACQVITYFDRDEIPGVLDEWGRVLKSGGILRLSVPNFAVICKLYSSGFDLEYFLGTLYGKIPNGEEFTFHKTTFDEPSMRQILEEAGFQDIGLWDWRETEHASVDDFSQAYFPHMDKDRGMLFNLNIQATKPA